MFDLASKILTSQQPVGRQKVMNIQCDDRGICVRTICFNNNISFKIVTCTKNSFKRFEND